MPSTLPATASRRHSLLIIAVIALIAAASLAAGLAIIATASDGSTADATAQPPRAVTLDSYARHSTRRAVTSSARYYAVASGDTLASISQREYRRYACWPGIYRHNRGIIGANPDVIEVGQHLVITGNCDARPVRIPAPRPVADPVTIDVQRPATPAASSGSILSYVDEVFGSGASCAVEILDHESGTSWGDVTIANPSSGAYGLPQALPGAKMAAFGSDWATNPVTQLRWMASYVNSSYGGICPAAAHDLSTGTY
jgi:hypothetical protein